MQTIASKLSAGEQVENINAFSAAVARFIWLEHSRKKKTEAVGDDLPETPVEPDLEFLDNADTRNYLFNVARRWMDTGVDGWGAVAPEAAWKPKLSSPSV